MTKTISFESWRGETLQDAIDFCERFNFGLVFFSKWCRSMTVKTSYSKGARIEIGDVCCIDEHGGNGRLYKTKKIKGCYSDR